jgi:hypothetical protein
LSDCWVQTKWRSWRRRTNWRSSILVPTSSVSAWFHARFARTRECKFPWISARIVTKTVWFS